ncbi:hypothetical protein [Daejeonella lutea]|nr:hypothetical protein [Daejeonella lutea]
MKLLTNYCTLILLLCALPGFAQQDTTTRRTNTRGDRNTSVTTSSQTNVPRAQRQTIPTSPYRPTDPIGSDQPDVLLDVPHLSVDEITVEVENLKANLSLDARVASLVQLKAGVDVGIDKVKIGIKGVQASVLLVVRLDNVRAIIDKTLTTLDNNPQLVTQLLQTVDNTVNTVGGVANTALAPGGVLSQTINTLGQTVQRTLDTTGNIVEKTLDTTGKVVSSNNVGKLLDLPVISQTTNAAGNVVKRVRDTTGAVLEYTLDSAGKILNSRVVSSGPATNK